MELLRVATCAVACPVIAQRAAAVGDGTHQDGADRIGELRDPLRAQSQASRARVDAGQVKRLVSVDIAHACNHGLVEERSLDRTLAGKPLRQLFRGDGQSIGTELESPCIEQCGM